MKSPRKPWCPVCLYVRLEAFRAKGSGYANHLWGCPKCTRVYMKAGSLGSWPDYLCGTPLRCTKANRVKIGQGMRITAKLMCEGFKAGYSYQEVAEALGRGVSAKQVQEAVRRAL